MSTLCKHLCVCAGRYAPGSALARGCALVIRQTLSTGIKIEKLGAEYDPREDTVLRALVRMLAETAAAGAAEEA